MSAYRPVSASPGPFVQIGAARAYFDPSDAMERFYLDDKKLLVRSFNCEGRIRHKALATRLSRRFFDSSRHAPCTGPKRSYTDCSFECDVTGNAASTAFTAHCPLDYVLADT